MLTNEELKKKICGIVAPYISAWGDDERIADAIISAGYGDVKDLQVQVDSLEITNIALQAGYDDAEEDRLYWVNKYKEAEQRAEVSERAVRVLARKFVISVFPNGDWKELIEQLVSEVKKQAEKELAEGS